MPVDARPTIAAADDDPYLWLEEIEGAQALAWVAAQNDATLAKFGNARFTADRDTLTAILDRSDKIPFVTRRGPHLYNFWRDDKNPRGLWRRTTLEDFRTNEPSWEVILDVDALAAREGEDWVWNGTSTLPGSHDRAILRLSRGGSDAVVLREFDLVSRSFVKAASSCPKPKAGSTGSTETRCCCRVPMGGTWRPSPATPGRSDSGGAASMSSLRRSCSNRRATPWRSGHPRPHARRRSGLVLRQAGVFRHRHLDGRPHRSEGQARPAD